MSLLLGYAAFTVLLFLVGGIAWYLDWQKQHEQVMREALNISHSLEESLDQRIREMDDYRHELAEVLQSFDLEQVREADEEHA